MRLRGFGIRFLAVLSAACHVQHEPLQSENQADLSKISPPWAQWAIRNPAWVEPMEPFAVLGNIYYVGTVGLSSFLITTDEGHILLDGGLPQNADIIANNIATLGFDIENVKILINSHAHFDHSGGLARLKALSGASLIASAQDRAALEGGFYLGFEDRSDFFAPPVTVDKTIEDGDVIRLGEITMTAHLTPGHSRGCTSWMMKAAVDAVAYQTLFFCSATVAANRLIPEQYPGIVTDYQTTFRKTRDWKPDIFLSNHGYEFKLKTKRQAQLAGDRLAFVDKEAFQPRIRALEAGFMKALADAETSNP